MNSLWPGIPSQQHWKLILCFLFFQLPRLIMESCNWEDTFSWINKNSGKLNSKYSPAEKKSPASLSYTEWHPLLAVVPVQSANRSPDLSGLIVRAGRLRGDLFQAGVRVTQKYDCALLMVPAPVEQFNGQFSSFVKAYQCFLAVVCSPVSTGCDCWLDECWQR